MRCANLLCSVQGSVYSVLCDVRCVQCAVFSFHCERVVYMYYVFRSIVAQFQADTAQCLIHSALCSVHCSVCSVKLLVNSGHSAVKLPFIVKSYSFIPLAPTK